jgi:hypothetical protein
MNLLVYLFVPRYQLVQSPFVLLGLLLQLGIRSPTQISDHVFLKLFNTPDAFQYISNIVDPPFLYAQDHRSLIQVDGHVRLLLDQFNKFSGKDR